VGISFHGKRIAGDLPRQQNRRSRGHETLWFNSDFRISISEFEMSRLTSAATAFARQHPPAAKSCPAFSDTNSIGQNS
jgi:hypothetical protein